MTTVRRLFLYLSSFVGLAVTLTGIAMFITQFVNSGFDAFRNFGVSSTSAALALIVAGGAMWRFYWRTVQREAAAILEERAAGTRKLHLYGTQTISLILALTLAQSALSDVLLRVFDIGLSDLKPFLTQALIAALLAGVWWWHKRIADADQAAGADGARGGDVRRGYWFALTYTAILTAAGGVSAFLSGLLSHLGGESPLFSPFGGGSWMQTLFPPLTQIAAWGVAIWLFWLPSQKAAAAGDEVERASRARTWLVHLVLFSATISALGGAQNVLTDILGRLLQGPNPTLLMLTINGPLASLVVGGLLLYYFLRFVRPTLASPRLSEYVLAGTAFGFVVIAAVALVAAVFRMLGGAGDRIESLIVNVVPALLVGGGLWWWRWRSIEADAAGPDSAAARSYLWRKVYLYLYQFVGLALTLIGVVAILQSLIAAIFGQSLGGNALLSLAQPLSFILVGLGLMVYAMQRVSSDARLGALSVQEVMAHTLGDTAPTWAIAAVVGIVVGPFFVIILLALLGPTIGNIFNNIVGGF